jgi:hypothetical protein
MAKILVKTPKTTNGRDVKLGPDGKILYSESIVESAARPIFEKMNTQLPQALKRIITDYDGDGTVTTEPLIKIKKKKNED